MSNKHTNKSQGDSAFREWLSDNLRYLVLIIAALLIVVVIVMVIVTLTGSSTPSSLYVNAVLSPVSLFTKSDVSSISVPL